MFFMVVLTEPLWISVLLPLKEPPWYKLIKIVYVFIIPKTRKQPYVQKGFY